jgi:hypothetical protein
MWITEGLKTGDEFVRMGRREVGGVVVVEAQDDYSIIDRNERGSNSGSCPYLRLCLSPSWAQWPAWNVETLDF